MTSRIRMSIILLLIPVMLSAQSYLELVELADKSIAEGDWSGAETNLLEAISLRPEAPTNILLLSNLGIVQYNLGKDSLALASLDQAHRRAPKSVTVLLNRAEVLTAIGRDDEAYRDYTTVISLDSTLTEPRYMHAIMSLRRGDFNTSLADCKALEQMSPASEEANTAFGSYYSATEQWDKALPYYTALLEKQPTTHIYGARAVCYLMLQRLNEASADINSGLALDPKDGELYMYRAYLNKMRFEIDAAREDLRKAIELGIDRRRAMEVLPATD